ncbi:MAG TPA: AI-2E family transporter, partial [Cytophagales bacterium]|nr:AI-2E family transporter [Cytophagales bacterium]
YASRIIFDGIMGSVIFYSMFRSWQIYLTERRHWGPSWAALVIIIFSFIVLVLPFITLTWMVYSKIIYLQAHPDEVNMYRDQLWNFVRPYTDVKNPNEFIQPLQSKIFTLFTDALSSVTNVMLQLAMLYFFLFFMLRGHEEFEHVVFKYLPFKEKNVVKLGTEMLNITYSNLLGQSFICLIQGILISIGFYIFGLDDPLFWGTVCFFLSFLPVIGSPLVFVPAGVLQIASGHTFNGVGIMLWGFILVTNIDNVIRFYLAKRIGDVHPLITVVGVVIGLNAFGILGLVYGPLFISYFLLLIKIYEEQTKGKAVSINSEPKDPTS